MPFTASLDSVLTGFAVSIGSPITDSKHNILHQTIWVRCYKSVSIASCRQLPPQSNLFSQNKLQENDRQLWWKRCHSLTVVQESWHMVCKFALSIIRSSIRDSVIPNVELMNFIKTFNESSDATAFLFPAVLADKAWLRLCVELQSCRWREGWEGAWRVVGRVAAATTTAEGKWPGTTVLSVARLAVKAGCSEGIIIDSGHSGE